MRLLRGVGVLAIHLDGLVTLRRDQAAGTLVQRQREDPIFSRHTARLRNCFQGLELVATVPVRKMQVTSVSSSDENRAARTFADRATVDDRIVAWREHARFRGHTERLTQAHALDRTHTQAHTTTEAHKPKGRDGNTET